MKEILKNVLKNAKYPLSEEYPAEARLSSQLSDKGLDYIADFLLENGIIVPPCKVGDTVYAIGDKDGYQIKECKVANFNFESAEDFSVNVWFECDGNCEGCYFNSWSLSYCGEWGCDNEYGQSCILAKDFGKTVFLTREESEQALEKLKGGVLK